MEKLEGKQLEEYLRAVVDVQKDYILIRALWRNVQGERNNVSHEGFLREMSEKGPIMRGIK